MRRILSMLKEIREVQLESAGAPDSRIAEAGQVFDFLDSNLNGIRAAHQPAENFAEVMTSGDFTAAFGTYVQRAMVPGYTAKTFAFEQFVKPDTTPNFQPVTRLQNRSGVDDLEYVGEKGEARPGSIDDAYARSYRPYKWEKQFDFSMEALVNDDLGYFDDTAMKIGQAARRTLEKYVSRMLWNATTIARLVGLGALYSTTGRLTTARISTARMAFNQRVDARGEPIAAALRYIVHHPGLVDTAATIQNSMLVPELATNAANVVRGTFVAVEDPYAPGVAPNLPWYALADWRTNGLVPFVLARRQGVPGPWIGRKKSDIEFVGSLIGAGSDAPPIWGDFATSNIVIKVHDEWGTNIDAVEGNLFDFRGAYYSSGTAA